MTSEHTRPNKALKIAGMVVLAVLGAAVGSATARYIDVSGMAQDDALNLFIGVVMIAISVITTVIVLVRPTVVAKGCGLLQTSVMGLAGLMLILPIYGADWVSAEVAMAGVLVLLVIQTVANVMLWRQADEMLRRIIVETGALSFWTLQLALFVYAAAERLELVEGMTAWGMIGILLAVYMVASALTAARRGIH